MEVFFIFQSYQRQLKKRYFCDELWKQKGHMSFLIIQKVWDNLVSGNEENSWWGYNFCEGEIVDPKNIAIDYSNLNQHS